MSKLRRSMLINWALLAFVNLLWAAQYPAYKIAGDHMETAALNFWTFVFATLLLFPFLLRARTKAPRPSAGSKARSFIDFVLMGLLGIVPPSVLLAWGISHSSASNASILALTIPVLMTLMGALFLHEKITFVRVLSLALGLAGTLLVSINDVRGMSFGRRMLLGNIVILVAGAGSAFYNAYGKRLLQSFSEIEVLLYSYISGALACCFISLAVDSKPFYMVQGYPASAWASIAVLGFLSWGLAMVVWMSVLSRLEVGQVSLSIYFLPVFGLMLSVITLSERLHLIQLAGGALVLTATIALNMFDRPSEMAPEMPVVEGSK